MKRLPPLKPCSQLPMSISSSPQPRIHIRRATLTTIAAPTKAVANTNANVWSSLAKMSHVLSVLALTASVWTLTIMPAVTVSDLERNRLELFVFLVYLFEFIYFC